MSDFEQDLYEAQHESFRAKKYSNALRNNPYPSDPDYPGDDEEEEGEEE